MRGKREVARRPTSLYGLGRHNCMPGQEHMKTEAANQQCRRRGDQSGLTAPHICSTTPIKWEIRYRGRQGDDVSFTTFLLF